MIECGSVRKWTVGSKLLARWKSWIADRSGTTIVYVPGDNVTTLDPRACRERAERQFTHLVMAENYVRIYQHVQQTGELPASVK